MIDMWQKRTILLTKLTQPVWVREKKQTVDRREKKSGILEREKFYLLSIIPGDQTVGFRRGKKQSCSPRQRLRMVTGFGGVSTNSGR